MSVFVGSRLTVIVTVSRFTKGKLRRGAIGSHSRLAMRDPIYVKQRFLKTWILLHVIVFFSDGCGESHPALQGQP